MKKAIDILAELVDLKEYKDEFGKDDYYKQKQPLLWNKAKQLIEKTEKTNKVTLFEENMCIENVICFSSTAYQCSYEDRKRYITNMFLKFKESYEKRIQKSK